MNKATLEILLVNASGIKRTSLIGKPHYYVIIECANQHRISKLSPGEDHRTCWNQKFRFELPLIDWKRMTHLKLTIMDTELFKNGQCIGETIIYLGGIVAEGKNRGIVEMKPSPYNVVLEDGTFKGQLKIGIKFTITNEEEEEEEEEEEVDKGREMGDVLLPSSSTSTSTIATPKKKKSAWEAITNVWKSSWWKFWSYCSPRNAKAKQPKSKLK
ncbi:16 kDa phloem protein 1 [Linum grandiflorum]